MKSKKRQSRVGFLPVASIVVASLAITAVVGLQVGLIRSPFDAPEIGKAVVKATATPNRMIKDPDLRRRRPKPRTDQGLEFTPEVVHEEKSDEPTPKAAPAKSPIVVLYEERAARSDDTPEAQAKLALWCEENQLPAEARGHWEAVIRLAPDHKVARQKLGYKRDGKQWKTEAMLADETAQDKANKGWRERLGVLHSRMHNRGVDASGIAQKAVNDLSEIDDVRAAPMLWHVFAGHPSHHLMVAKQLAKLQSPRSSLMLAAVAAYSPDEKARRASVDELKTRDPVDFAKPLIGLLGPELKYKKSTLSREAGGPLLQALEIEDERFTRQFIYRSAVAPGDVPSSAFGDCSAMTRWANFGWSDEGKAMAREMNRLEAQRTKELADVQLQSDIEAVQAINRKIDERNGRVLAVLTETTGQDFRLDRDAWNGWLAARMGIKYVAPKQVAKMQFQDFVQPIYQPSFIAIPPTPT